MIKKWVEMKNKKQTIPVLFSITISIILIAIVHFTIIQPRISERPIELPTKFCLENGFEHTSKLSGHFYPTNGECVRINKKTNLAETKEFFCTVKGKGLLFSYIDKCWWIQDD